MRGIVIEDVQGAPMSDRTPPRRTAAQRLQALYVRALLRLLPHLITLLRHVSPRIRA